MAPCTFALCVCVCVRACVRGISRPINELCRTPFTLLNLKIKFFFFLFCYHHFGCFLLFLLSSISSSSTLPTRKKQNKQTKKLNHKPKQGMLLMQRQVLASLCLSKSHVCLLSFLPVKSLQVDTSLTLYRI